MTDRHPTPDHYVEFYVAFTHFNLLLFESVLPNCLITMSRRGRGYFKAQAWLGRGRVTDEISLSPDQLGAPTLDTLAVIVHEMTHQWQAHFGAPHPERLPQQGVGGADGDTWLDPLGHGATGRQADEAEHGSLRLGRRAVRASRQGLARDRLGSARHGSIAK